ncbi:MAG: nicotinate-nucleotide diphosphorylase, partial [Candidatus Heimdallarchaeaceae archaeon]
MFPTPLIDEDIKKWIKDDITYWDVTTSLIPNIQAEATIIAKQQGIIAGLQVMQRVFEIFGAKFEALVEEGQEVEKKTTIAKVSGPIYSLLQAERIALNIFGRMSGIATLTARMVEKAKEFNPNLRIC